jgi:hypothetical protein
MTPYGFGGGSHIQPGHTELLMKGGAVHVEKSWDALARRILT